MIINSKKHAAKWAIIAGGIVIISVLIGLGILINTGRADGKDNKANYIQNALVQGSIDKNSLPQKRINDKQLFVISKNTINFPEELLSDRQLIDLRELISLAQQQLNQDMKDDIIPTLSIYKERWENNFLPTLKTADNSEITAFAASIDNGFELAYEAIDEGSQQKLDQARDLFAKLCTRLPGVLPNKDIMLEDIKMDLLYSYHEATADEVRNITGSNLITPKYLPEGFHYYGVYMCNSTVKQIWYDPQTLEVLLVTQYTDHAPDQDGQIIITDNMESSGIISDMYTWAKYYCSYDFKQNGVSVEGYMLLNNEANQDEYNKILRSLKTSQ